MRALAVLILVPTLAAAEPLHLPWKEAGLTGREAAAHLLNRFAYGPRPGEVDAVVKMGLDRWFERQLTADLPDRRLDERLDSLPALELSATEMAEADRPRRELARELAIQLLSQKLWRAVDSENQLEEVMTDFWFNHFNVSLTDNQSRAFVLSYERDAIRPHALGSVRDLLEATAKHPAMLLYLDNAMSSAPEEAPRTFTPRRWPPAEPKEGTGRVRPRGLNENYARELLELHTLGVDGGYTQQDVIQVARAFTGWSILPPGPRRDEVERRLERVRRLGGTGFRQEGEFLFRADQHDAGAKTILGRKLPAGRGIEDGEQVLDLLAVHPATAKHLARKLAVRFVSDNPPQALVNRLAAVYLKTGGQVRPVLRALAESPELWSRAAVGAKIKSPFELAASSLRGLGAEVDDPRGTLRGRASP